MYEKLAKSMADKEKGKLEFENLRIELYEQEADERLKAREQVSVRNGYLFRCVADYTCVMFYHSAIWRNRFASV